MNQPGQENEKALRKSIEKVTRVCDGHMKGSAAMNVALLLQKAQAKAATEKALSVHKRPPQ